MGGIAIAPLRDEAGRLIGMATIMRDVSVSAALGDSLAGAACFEQQLRQLGNVRRDALSLIAPLRDNQ